MRDKGFRTCYDLNMVYEYTCHQKANFSKGYDYWVIFISDSGTLAKLHSVYRVCGYVPDTADQIPAGLPESEANGYQGQGAFYHLEQLDLLSDYEGKLIIDWGPSALMWHQKGTTEKPIVSLQPDEKKVFSGYEDLILTFDQLKDIVENPSIYAAWHTALSAVNAIYLIVDRENGRQYVGSAYGEGGLLGRWSCYVKTHHGNNKLMKEVICSHPERYHLFQFSILQILPKTMAPEEIIKTERCFKRKLLSIGFGMNDN